MFKEKQKRGKVSGFAFLFTAIAFFLSIATAVSGAFYRSDYNIAVNQVSPRNFRAPYDIENEIATERLRASAAELVQPRYAIDTQVKANIISKLDLFFDEVNILRMRYNPILGPGEADSVQGGSIVPPEEGSEENGETANKPVIDNSGLMVTLPYEQLEYLVNIETMGTSEYNLFIQDIYASIEKLLDAGIRGNDGLVIALNSAKDEFNRKNWNEVLKEAATSIVQRFLEANDFIDEISTQKARDDAAAAVEPIMYLKDQNIVAAYDIITEEAYAVLVRLGFGDRSVLDNIFPLIGTVSITVTIYILGILYLYFYGSSLVETKKSIVLLFTLYATGIILARLLSFVPFPFIPVLLICMLTSLLIDARLAIMMCICVVANSAVANNADIKYVIYFLINGVFVSILSKYTAERSKIFMVALIVSFFSVMTVCAVYFHFDKAYTTEMRDMLVYSALSGVLTVIVCVGSLPFWEAGFDVITSIKLLELLNPNNKLLRRLIIEAPGTYHHSLIVANLSETGAYDIGANPELARVGGYYHDIGKIKYPQYFVENQAGENLHDYMDAPSSAKVIMGHITAGLELAEGAKLPKPICDFIKEHHGNTLIKYFYFKAKKETPDTEIKEEDFRYPYPKPKTREAAVVMLADTVEAAVRSMIPSGKTMREVEAFVRSLIKDKLDDGQLDDSNLTINDLNTLTDSFMRVFKGMYHERIPYPKDASGVSIKTLPDITDERR